MMIFDLVCEEGHRFEGWFQDHISFQEQLERGLVECPVCGSQSLTQVLSTGGVVHRGGSGDQGAPEDSFRPEADVREDKRSPEKSRSPLAVLRALRRIIETHFEDVGPNFAKTALKIHYGLEEERNIRGTTTEEEEKTLKEEGVDFIKIPFPAPSGRKVYH